MSPVQRCERVDLSGGLRGEVMAFQPMIITQISEGGARVDTTFPLHIDSLHDVRFTLGSLSVVLKARVVHCRLVAMGEGGVTYRAGVEFVEPSQHALAAVRAFMDDLKSGRMTT